MSSPWGGQGDQHGPGGEGHQHGPGGWGQQQGPGGWSGSDPQGQGAWGGQGGPGQGGPGQGGGFPSGQAGWGGAPNQYGQGAAPRPGQGDPSAPWTDPGSAPGPAAGPGNTGRPRRPWAAIVIALGCVGILLLGLLGGITVLLLNRTGDDAAGAEETTQTDGATPTTADGESPSPTPAEDTGFTVITPYDEPPESADELWTIMTDNPLSTGGLPDVASCELPQLAPGHDAAQLDAYLQGATTCLNQAWSTASSDRGLPWSSRSLTVYTWPDVPGTSSCEVDTFAGDRLRLCNLDNTIYWPVGAYTDPQQTDPSAIAGTYLMELSFAFAQTVSWESSLLFYEGYMEDKLVDDPERQAEADRRFVLQLVCFSAAMPMQLPAAAQPPASVRDAYASPERWADSAEEISAESRAAWFSAGFESGGDLAACNTWLVPPEQVA